MQHYTAYNGHGKQIPLCETIMPHHFDRLASYSLQELRTLVSEFDAYGELIDAPFNQQRRYIPTLNCSVNGFDRLAAESILSGEPTSRLLENIGV